MNKVLAALYVHVPFCVHKCGYCDFNSWGETRRGPQELWALALQKQVKFWSQQLRETPIQFSSVFFGGGTPSLLAEDLLAETLHSLKEAFVFAPSAEWTLECNPETLTAEKLGLFDDLGINRISVGLQSFQDHHLERLERHARRKDNFRALELIKAHWRGRWSGDLMFGLPNQTLKDWSTELGELLEFKPSHVSAYQLTLTTERSKNWSQAPEDHLLDFFDLTEERLGREGILRYEVSNFSTPGEESQHNLGYWRMNPFLGLGPGAAGVLSPSFFKTPSSRLADVSDANPWDSSFGAHQKNPDRFERWIEAAGDSLFELGHALKPRRGRDHLFELLMMGLRLNEGVDLSRLERLLAPGVRLELPTQLSEFIRTGGGRLAMTPAGLRILDHLLPKLYDYIEKIAQPNLDSLPFDPMFK